MGVNTMELKSIYIYLLLRMQVLVRGSGYLECSALPGSNPHLCWQTYCTTVVYYHGVIIKHGNVFSGI